METSTTLATATVSNGWILARNTTFGIVVMGAIGALAGFVCARFLWM